MDLTEILLKTAFFVVFVCIVVAAVIYFALYVLKEAEKNKEREDGNLVKHAKRELELMGEDDDVIAWYLDVVRAFAKFGHSGGSAMATIPVLHDLLQYKNLTSLTNDPDEWFYHGEDTWGSEGGVWQNIRNGEAFSHDGGMTYYLLSEGGNDTNREPLHFSENIRGL